MSNQRRPLQNGGLSSAVKNTLMMNEEQLMTINNFLGYQVTINFQHCQTFHEQRCNVPQPVHGQNPLQMINLVKTFTL